MNDSGADVLLQGGASGLAASVELVGFELRDGEPAYTPLPAIPVRNQREVVLAPNGLALRLNGLAETLVRLGRLDEARIDHRHENAMRRQFGVEGFGQVYQRGLGRPVGGGTWQPAIARDRGDDRNMT